MKYRNGDVWLLLAGLAVIPSLAVASPPNYLPPPGSITSTPPMPYSAPMVVVPSNSDYLSPPPSTQFPTATIAAPKKGENMVEAGMNYHGVSNQQGNWVGEFVRGHYYSDDTNRWNAELLHQHAFKDDGYYMGVSNTHNYNERWFSEIGLGGSTATGFLPRVRLDASISRRWLDAGNWVTTLGTTFTKASETYEGYGLWLTTSYYFSGPWAFQAGLRGEMSNPGSVYSGSGFTALTYGYNKQQLLTGRLSAGREAYQLLGSQSITTAFNSGSLGLNWRQWLDDDWGYTLDSEYYHNPYYHRVGGALSLFMEF